MRQRSIVSILIVFLSVAIMANFVFAQKDDSKKAETIVCPVTGEKVLKSEAAGPFEYKGTPYYFCCNGCLEKFKNDPETYLNKTKDIVCGMSVDKRTAQKVAYEGKEFYFCSDNCKASFEKDAKPYIMKMKKASHVHVEGEAKGCEGCPQSKECQSSTEKKCCDDKKPEKKM